MLLGKTAQQHLPCIRIVSATGVVGELEELWWRGIDGLPLVRIASCRARQGQQGEEQQR
ncbi:hypothetical protein [Persicimonas caeni]|uniref:hypothetical protein n=1 Tax=Persicimonas caeni TaxID=2292766 RepID=UPI00143CFCE5|nr:hypothetical protein [Persicimonas caeni]